MIGARTGRGMLRAAAGLGVVSVLAASSCSSPGSKADVPAVTTVPAAATALLPAKTVDSGSSPTLSAPTTLATSTVTATPTTDDSFGPGSFDLLDPTVGLGALTSYRATLKVSLAGTRDGQPLQLDQTYILAADTAASARVLTVQTGDGTAPPRLRADVKDAVFVTDGNGICTGSVPDAADSADADDGSVLDVGATDPAALLRGLSGAEAAGSEILNGVAANHYTFDQRALGSRDPATVTGDVWVATAGSYVIKYTLTSIGPSPSLGKGVDGTLNLDYELTDINQPVVTALPPGCPPTFEAPLLADATAVERQPGFVSYSTASSPADSLAFYQQQLPTLNWTLSADVPIVSDQGGRLRFVSDAADLTVSVSVGDTGTRVVIIQTAGAA